MHPAPAHSLSVCEYASGAPRVSARVRTEPEDFQVDEVLGFEPDGEGSHALLRVRKQGLNTQWVAKELARVAGVRAVDVGMCGLKDRHAVTHQWFSVNLSGLPEPDWETLNSADLRIVSVHRHGRKLRRGAHRANRFRLRLRLRDVQGDPESLRGRLVRLKQRGVPNYFGEQRFGREEGNLSRAYGMLTGELRVRDRHRRGLYLSAARAMLFNRVLSDRVARGDWDQALAGDVMMLDGTHSVFRAEIVDQVIAGRVAGGDIHPTGPLWGRGDPIVSGNALDLERRALEDYGRWCQGLADAGLKQERRALRLPLDEADWEFPNSHVVDMVFTLPAGGYATSVLRELVSFA